MSARMYTPSATDLTTAPAATVNAAWFRAAATLLGVCAAFLYRYTYEGIQHDTYFYTLQALARIHVDSLGAELTGGFGAQDRFTLFSPLYAQAVAGWGIDAAALVVTAVGLTAFAAAVYAFSRALVGPALAGLGLLAVVVLPAEYGAERIFAYIEPFATPRPFAQACALAGLALLLHGRRLLAAGMLALGLAIHPLMAFPAVLVALACALPARFALLPWAAALYGLLAAAAIAWLAPAGPLSPMDSDWLAALDRWVPYLLLDRWHLIDWQRCLVPLATLGVALCCIDDPRQRRVAFAALAVGAVGLLISAFATWAMPIEIVVQGQAWRWIWLAKAIAAVLLVPTAIALWTRGSTGRLVLALTILGWLGSEDALGLPSALLAALFAVSMRTPGGASLPITIAAASAVIMLGAGVLQIAAGGTVVRAAALATALALGARLIPWRYAPHAVAVGTAWLLAAQVAVTSAEAQPSAYTEHAVAALQPWRDRIPSDEVVLFLPHQAAPWLLLHRRSYHMLSPAVFSRESALATDARLAKVARTLGGIDRFGDIDVHGRLHDRGLSLPQAQTFCADPAVDWLITRSRLPAPSTPTYVPGPLEGARLYACRDLPGEP